MTDRQRALVLVWKSYQAHLGSASPGIYLSKAPALGDDLNIVIIREALMTAFKTTHNLQNMF
jgi:hypothetical protein